VESLRPSTLDLEALKQQVKGGDVDARLTTTQLAIAVHPPALKFRIPPPPTLTHDTHHRTRHTTMQKADEALGIPQIVEADDLVLTTTPDELSVLTYVGYFRAWSDSDPYRCMVMGRGIEAPTLGEPNQFQVSIYGTVNKEPLVLKDDQMKVQPRSLSLSLTPHKTAHTKPHTHALTLVVDVCRIWRLG
jgi:hypothetical protein